MVYSGGIVIFYSLNENYLLRGWEKLPTAIVHRLAGEVAFIETHLYDKIRNNNWMLFEGSPFLSAEQKLFFTEMAEKGVFELTEHIRPLSEMQQYKTYPNRFLRAVHWAITGNCNCCCRHCYMSAPGGKVGEFSHDKCMELIHQFEEAGVQIVTLTGGEPLIRKDFLEIVKALTYAGIKIAEIMSNGLLVDAGLLESLEKVGQKPAFNMSFDGIGCHDRMRGISGAEKAVIRAFRVCAERGFSTAAEFCLHKGNAHSLRDSVRLLSELGCQSLKVNGLRAEGEGAKIQEEILSADEMFQIFLDYIPQFMEDALPIDLMLSGFFRGSGKPARMEIPFEKCREQDDCSNYCLCGHARNWMHITADGFIVPCIPIGSAEFGKTYFPSVFQMSIQEALQDSKYMRFIDTRLKAYFKENPECEVCEFRNRCAGGCRGEAAHNGGLMGKDELACAFYLNGWYERITRLGTSFGFLGSSQTDGMV